MNTRLALPRLVGYALGAFGTGVFSTVPTVLLLYFCTEILGMPAILAGVAVFLPKVWALVWDPLVGLWSDRTRTAIGRRRPFMLAGAVGVSLAFLALFSWPHAQGAAAFISVSLIYFVLANAYSLFAVPFIAVPAEISADPAERERVTAWRIGLAMIGVLIGAGLAPMLVDWGGGGRRGYGFMAAVVAAICGLGMLSAFFATPSRLGAAVAPGPAPSLADSLAALRGSREFLKLVAAYVIQITGVGVISALTPYWIVTAAGHRAGDAGLALGILLLATIASTPVWVRLMRKVGARRGIAAAAVLYGVATLGFKLIPPTSTPWVLAVYALVGVPFAGLQVGPFALAAHLIHEAAGRLGARQEGLFTGLWTAAEKLGLALGPGLAGLGLAAIGFVSGGHAPEVAARLTWLIAVAPAILLWTSLLFLRAPGSKV